MKKEQAIELLNKWVSNNNLKKHMYAVGLAMKYYAEIFKEDEEKWEVVGILHDMDWEKYPTSGEGGPAQSAEADYSGRHPYKAVEYLKSVGLDEKSLDAILGHASYTKTARLSKMAKTLFAVDELTGFIVAVALIKPEKSLVAVNVESVKRRLHEKRFASGVNREDIYKGAEELNIPLDKHIQNVILAMQKGSDVLGL